MEKALGRRLHSNRRKNLLTALVFICTCFVVVVVVVVVIVVVSAAAVEQS